MRRALQEYEVGGIKTTLPFFRKIIEDQEFIEGKLDTGFIPRWQERQEKSEAEETEKDLPIIAAALNISKIQAVQTIPVKPAESRWVREVRLALHAKRL